MTDQDAKGPSSTGGAPSWLEQPGNVRKLVIALAVVCLLLLAIDVAVHKHGPFPIEHLFGFYAWFGLLGCAVMVVAAKVVRLILMRPEDYYDR